MSLRKAGRSGSLAAAVGVVVLLVLPGGALAAARVAKAPGRPLLLAPRSGALVTGGTALVRVAVPPAATGFRAELVTREGGRFRTRQVTRLFRAAGPGMRAATLRLGPQLSPGEDHLSVTTRGRGGGRQVAQTDFLVARPSRGMVALQALGDGHRAPVTARLRLARGAQLRARLNGRPVGTEFGRIGARRLAAQLAADDGLRFGRNRLVLTAFDRDGHYQRLRRSFTIARDQPLVGAGPDRRVVAGNAIRLDGSSTRAGRSGVPLRLRWKVVDRPPGSKARLRGAGRARPQLIADRPGRYRVRLTAREPGRSARGRSSRAVASRQEVAPTSADTVTLAAQPDVLPQGVPVQTVLSGPKPGIRIGSSFYPASEPQKNWMEMVVLDRTTLEPIPVAGDTVNTYGSELADTSTLAEQIGRLSSADLVIVTGLGRAADLEEDARVYLAEALAGSGGIGASLPEEGTALETGNWSVIGVPRTPAGTAHQCVDIACGSLPAAVRGEISGYLQLDLREKFAFSWPPASDTFDTQATGSSSTANSMQIAIGEGAPQTYSSTAVSGPGFHLLVLDPGTLAPRGNFTYSASVGSSGACGGSGCLQQLVGELLQIAASSEPELVLLTSFGKPAVSTEPAAVPVWNSLARVLSRLGGNPWVVLALNGSGDYTLIGRTGLLGQDGPNAGTELSQIETGAGAARLAGVFERNRQGMWDVGANGNPDAENPPSTFEPGLLPILEAPERPFPFPTTPSEWAAERYIAAGIGLGPVDPRFGIRAAYWRDQTIDWASEEAELQKLGPCAEDCPPDFNVAVFRSSKREFLTEFPQVAKVMKLLGYPGGDLPQAISEPYDNASYGFTAIANRIRDLYTPPPVQPQAEPFSEILIAAFSIASDGAGVVTNGGGIVAAFGITAVAGTLTESLTNNEDGSSALEPANFDGDVAQFGTNMKTASESSVESIGRVAALLVSDRGRLEAAAQQAGGAWAVGPEAATQLQESLARSLGGYMWSAMLPIPVTLEGCGQRPPIGVPEIGYVGVNLTERPLAGTFESGYVYAVDPFGNPLPQGIYERLFSRKVEPQAPEGGNVNLDPRYFYALANLAAPGSTTPTSPGFIESTIGGGEVGCPLKVGMDPPG